MKLIKNNQSFTCLHCAAHVPKSSGVSRDHCPFCLYSLHVDLEVPGDRLNPCNGLMKAVSVRTWKKERYKVLFECETCRHQQWNITAEDDSIEALSTLIAQMNQSLLESK